MLGWLFRMIVGRFSRCDHEFEILKSGRVNSMTIRGETIKNTGSFYDLRCKKCGDIKDIYT